MRLALRRLGTLAPTAFAPSTVIPGAGVTQASDSVSYQKTAIQQTYTQVAPLKTSGFKPIAAALDLPHVSRSAFTVSRDVGYQAAGSVTPIEDATGVETAGQDVAAAHEESLTPAADDVVLDSEVTLIDDANRRSSSAETPMWPWVLGVGGGVLVVGFGAWLWGRRRRR